MCAPRCPWLVAGVPLAQQAVVLEYRMDRTVATADEAPTVLGRMPDAFVAQLGCVDSPCVAGARMRRASALPACSHAGRAAAGLLPWSCLRPAL